MVNTRQKGNRLEREAEEILHEKGFNTARMPHTRYGDSDFFNMYDIIAMKPGAPLKMVQVKANQASGVTELKNQSINEAPFKHAEIELWQKFDYQGWKIRRLNPETENWELQRDDRKDI
jgi:Holliday junction resolvase